MASRKALHEDPHMLDAADTGFLVNTGNHLILVDAGSGTWFGGGKLGHLLTNLRSAGYTPEEVDMVLVTHLHSDHTGGVTTQDGQIVFPNADIYVAKEESDPTAAAATRNQLLPKLASENTLMAAPHMLFPGSGHLQQEGTGYRWAPVTYTAQWVER